ncbi:MAG TPA: inositol monophosphatase family protein [Candidatus Bathyarchaeia archaeon]|nr:inositol monophosphatase family protein [Candidatus Bathyarchaeia archaeon]
MKDYKLTLHSVLCQTGRLILSYRAKIGKTEEKKKNEIVTPADIAANEYITEQLSKKYPEIPIFSEEGTKDKSQCRTRWIVDPLDGTTPWVWGNSGFSISVALEDKGQIVVGAVYDPVMKEFFYAEKNRGATRNSKPIKPVKNIPLKEMFVVVDWGNKKEERKEGLSYLKHFFLPEMFARRVVPQFAPALGLCRIAEGRIHALVCNITYVEDHSAGALILQEAGGYCSNFYHTKSFKHRERGIIAANERATHKLIVKFLKSKGFSLKD